jgi:tRNA threonylcarbamoyladenosine biosynthesis protein TsaE
LITVDLPAPSATEALGATVAGRIEAGDVILLTGELGAGKTTFTQGLAAGLGVTDAVVSPTFTITREYQGRLRLVHVDLYRLDRAQEVLDLGLEDVADDAVLVVEWGEVAVAYLTPEHLEVRLTADPTGSNADQRTIAITPHGRTWAPRTDALAGVVGAV